MGLIDLNGNLGRLYGSIGLAIDKPNVLLEAVGDVKPEIYGLEKGLVSKAASAFCGYYGVAPRMRIEVKEAIPRHTGLGSGTQLSLAVGTAIARLHGIKASPRQLASVLGRGFISGAGVAAFEAGGFAVDGGVNVLYQIPPQRLFHCSFPRGWVFVVALPKIGKGLSEKQEKDAFKNIIPGPEKNAAEISRLVLMKMLPSLLEKDIEGFGYAMSEIDRKTGEYYKKISLGSTTEKIIQHMIGAGAQGAGQSSWGPAVYGLTERKYGAELKAEVKEYMKENKIAGKVFVAGANNQGAEVEKLSS